MAEMSAKNVKQEELNSDGTPKISKAAAKKAAQKAEKAAKKAEHAKQQAALPQRPKEVKPKVFNQTPSLDTDPMDATVSVGWLKDVYEIAPVGAAVITRFPPEPNGYLHIGHAKAIAVNFGFAKFHGGKTFLRYDDTNPEKEEEQYFKSIKETVEWLGYKPFDVTYSSDRFERLYKLAELLIKKDKAYVCSCTQDDMKHQKGVRDGKEGQAPRYGCAHRTRPIEESLSMFRDMRDGKYKAKEAVLRMKQSLTDQENGNPYMWDLPAYRIPEEGKRIHHRTNDKWQIYPTYDFTHCLCDAMEQITHSLCTTEFRTAREPYDWLVDQLKEELPAVPQQREYGRLNITGTVLSKRKILALVNNKIVRGWDDPRLYTIIALRRRGIPPGAIRAFVAELGVSDTTTAIQLIRFETVVRKYLEKTVPRLMLIPDPIKVIIDNLPANHLEELTAEFMRGDPSFGTHTIPFTNTLYIDRSDFREVDSPDFFRLAPGKAVGLLNVPHPIHATSCTKDSTSGLVNEVHATYSVPASNEKPIKPQAYIQWVGHSPAHKSPIRAEVRIFNSLFKSETPDDAPGGFLSDVNPNSEEIFPNAVLECGFEKVRAGAPWPKDHVANLHPGPWQVRFQGMRVAYFALDTESNLESGKVVLNKIVSLKEDSGKAA